MRHAINVVLAAVLAGSSVAVMAVDSSPSDAAKPAPDERDPLGKAGVLSALRQDGRFKLLLSALRDTEFEKTLSTDGIYTFFAPMDEAFARVPKLAELLGDREKLTHVLNRHFIVGRTLDTDALWKEIVLQPKEGKELKVKCSEKNIEINDAKILVRDMRAKDAIVHGIDHVLMDDNDSFMGSAGEKIERGLKKGATKIKETFKGKGDGDNKPPENSPAPETREEK